MRRLIDADADSDLDNSNPIGPCLVAAKMISDPQKLPLKCVVNGQTLQDGTTESVISLLVRAGLTLLQAANLRCTQDHLLFVPRDYLAPRFHHNDRYVLLHIQ